MSSTGWTTPADVRAELSRRWNRGTLLADLASDGSLFPLRISLKRPNSAELVTRFEEVVAWARKLRDLPHASLETREINHRQLGANVFPVAVWFDSVDAAAAALGTTRDLARFRGLMEMTNARLPAAMPLLAQRPMEALVEADVWALLLDVADWVAQHPKPNIYLRQVDLPGVHTKLIEQHQRTLTALLNMTLVNEVINRDARAGDFARRYGFRSKPRMVRFRSLDPNRGLLAGDDRHYMLTAADLGRIDPPARAFITENETNFLAFPDVADGVVIFGAGSGLEHLADVPWLLTVPTHYWGDIDTHGFAILDQLRAVLPHASSLLMDTETLTTHKVYWGTEEKPTSRELHRLSPDELAVYNDLRDNRLRPNLRLEQERIRFGRVRAAVALAQRETAGSSLEFNLPPPLRGLIDLTNISEVLEMIEDDNR